MHLRNNTLLQGGKYKIERFIASGGFGCTYEAYHTLLDMRVALKEFFVSDFCNRDERTGQVSVATKSKVELICKLKKKFMDEARSLYMMKHPGIVRVIDVFEENGTAYYAMEYIDGHSLSDVVKKRGKLPEAESVDYIRQVAEALKYVHSLNRLHLDIKPGNIMLNKDGKVVLIDFGASKHYDDETGENTSTLLGINTKGYAPVEQVNQSFKSFSPATDIYALGATLYKLLTGITPPPSTLLQSEEATLIPLPSSISSPTCKAVEAAMQLLRKNRPQSVEDWKNILVNDDLTIVDVVNPNIKLTPDSKHLTHTQPQLNNSETFVEALNYPIEEAPTVADSETTEDVKKDDEKTLRKSVEKNSKESKPRSQFYKYSTKMKQLLSSIGEKCASKSNNKLYVGTRIAAFFAIVSVGIYMSKQSSPGEDGVGIPPISINTTGRIHVEEFEYKDSNGKLLYYWTGSIDKAKKPVAHGTAIYPSNDKDGRKSYVGKMKNGLRDGDNATLTYTNGNYFKGSFNNDKLSNGQFNLKSDGMYYIGTFKNNTPYNGKWYYLNGSLYSTVTNGKEK